MTTRKIRREVVKKSIREMIDEVLYSKIDIDPGSHYDCNEYCLGHAMVTGREDALVAISDILTKAGVDVHKLV